MSGLQTHEIANILKILYTRSNLFLRRQRSHQKKKPEEVSGLSLFLRICCEREERFLLGLLPHSKQSFQADNHRRLWRRHVVIVIAQPIVVFRRFR